MRMLMRSRGRSLVWTTCGLGTQWIQRVFEEYILGLSVVDQVLKKRAGRVLQSNDGLEVYLDGSLQTWGTAREI